MAGIQKKLRNPNKIRRFPWGMSEDRRHFRSMARRRSPAPHAGEQCAPVSRLPARTKRGAKRPDGESLEEELDTLPPPALLPRLVFFLLLGLLAALLAIEVRNGLRHPGVRRVPGPKGAPALTFYEKGYASAREAWLFDEPKGTRGPPRLIQRIDCRPQMTDIGEIRWTTDGQAVYAAGRTAQSRGVPVVRWLFEFSNGRLYVSRPELGLPGRTVFVEDPAALTARWHQHKGAGPLAAAWYDLGALGPGLFSWQATRWEKALPDSPE